MSKYNKTILTNAGFDLAARASSGKAKFTITRAATSTEKLASKSISELQQLTTLPSLMQYGEISNVADSAQDKSIVIGTELIFNNKDLSTSYNINTIGLYAKEDGSDKEFLYALTTAVEPETMPDFKDKVLFKFNLTMFVVVGQTDNVSVNVTDNGVVTQEQLAKVVQTLPQKQDLTNLYNKINTDIKNLSALNSVSGNNISNTIINLDTFSTLGISQFLGCQLKSDGNMTGFDSTQKNLYGWIFNVPKWNGAKIYEQIVYISDSGQGNLLYTRTKADATSMEDFIKIANNKDIDKFGKLQKISLNDGTPINPNDEGIANLKVVTSVQNIAPDNKGNVKLTKPAPIRDLDKIVEDGIYDLDGTYNGYYVTGLLIVRNFTIRTFQLLISYDFDPMMQYRYINVNVGLYPNWVKLLNQDDYKNLANRIAILENKEIVHQCDDLDSGIAYSKAHPNVLVATP
ncbi:MAG: hypothetical protein [Bacteriophage sp.]|nr:MAG: hypothetical protein [Bacteriophage sp.]